MLGEHLRAFRRLHVGDVPTATIEIKSPDDTFDDVYEKCLEYQAMGVPNIIVIDPDHRRQHVFAHDSLRVVDPVSISLKNGTTISLPPAVEIFAEFDENG